MPSIIDRYIIRQIWVPALAGALVITVVLIGGAVQKEVGAVLQKLPIAQFTLSDIARISFYATPNLAGYIIPITFLLGIMLTFGRMGQFSELIALKAAGIPLKRLVLPVIVAGGFLSFLTFLIFDWGQPWAFRRFNDLRMDILVRLTLDALPTGEMHQYGDWRVYIGEKDDAGVLHNIVVLKPQGDGKATTYFAERAEFAKLEGENWLRMYQGHLLPPIEDNYIHRWRFDEMELHIPSLPAFGAMRAEEANSIARMHTLQRAAAAEYKAQASDALGISIRSYRIAMGERLAFPLMCLSVSIVAAPIGVRAQRSGRSFTFASGFLIVAVYFILRRVFQPTAFIPELWETLLLAQVPNLVLASVGALLLWRVDRV